MSSGPSDRTRAGDAPEEEGPGQRLRRAREAAGLSVGDVSARLHLDIKTVQAIESEDYANLPAPAFVRGYLRGYARMVNLPLEPLVKSFDVRGLAPPPLVADISERPQAKSTDFPVQIFTWLIVVGLAVLVFLWWRGQVFSSDPSASNDTATLDSTASAGNSAADPTQAASSQTSEDDSQTDLRSANGESSGTLTSVAGIQAGGGEATAVGTLARANPAREPPLEADTSPASSPSIDGSNTQDSPAGAAPSADGTGSPSTAESDTEAAPSPRSAGDSDSLVLRFKHDAWVEVYDRDDKKLYWNMARSGQNLTLNGKGPMRVVLGKTRNVEVRFNDRPVNFSAFTKGGVAKFKIGAKGISASQPNPG